MYCYDCNKDVTPKIKQEIKSYNFRNKSFKVQEKNYYCPNCGLELIDETLDESLKNIYNEYLKLYNLNLDSFKNIRKSLNLSQDNFAASLGWGKKSIVRFENNDVIPSNEYLKTYMKLNKNKDYIFECLELNKNNISTKLYYKIINSLNLNLDVKSRNVIIYILNKRNLFTIPLLKILFAIDFLSYKETGKPITSFKYAKLPYGPVVDNYETILNEMLIREEINLKPSTIIDNDIKYEYGALKNSDTNLFNDKEIKIMDKVINKLKNKSASSLSNWSHEFKGWIETPIGSIISYKEYAKYFEL